MERENGILGLGLGHAVIGLSKFLLIVLEVLWMDLF